MKEQLEDRNGRRRGAAHLATGDEERAASQRAGGDGRPGDGAPRFATFCMGVIAAGCWSSSGPCSIHDSEAALEYARRLRPVAEALRSTLLVVMRTYFEKPRTTVGWKGLVNDPRLDGSCDVEAGLRLGAHDPRQDQRSRRALRQRGARSDHAAVHLRSSQLGVDRCADDREPDPTASWRAACRCRSASRTAPTATCRLALHAMISARHPHTFSRDRWPMARRR